MTTSRLVTGPFCAPLLAVGLLGTGMCSAAPALADPLVCAPQAGLLNCSPGRPIPTAGETAFITDVRYQRIPVDDTRLLAAGRGICIMLKGGESVKNVIPQVAAHLGLDTERADDVVNSATAYVCPGAPLNE